MNKMTRTFAGVEAASAELTYFDRSRAEPLHTMPRQFSFDHAVERIPDDMKGPEFTDSTISAMMPRILASAADERAVAQIIHAPAGTGKTYQAVRSVAALIANGTISKVVLYLVPTHALAAQTEEKYRNLDILARTYLGQSQADACTRSDTAQAVAEIGLSARDLCGSEDDEDRCPDFYDCPLQKLRAEIARNRPPVLIAPVEYLRSGGLPPEVMDPGLIIIDESIVSTMIRHDTIQAQKLGKVWSEKLRSLGELEEGYEALHDLQNDLLTSLGDPDPVSRMLKRYGSMKELLSKINAVIDLRQSEMRALIGGIGGRTTAEHVSRARLPKYYSRELQLWSSLRDRVLAIHAGRETSNWVAARTAENHEDAKREDVYIDFIDRIEFPSKSPVIMLDASADEAIYQRLFRATHTVKYTRYARPIDTLHRTAIVGLSCSKSSLTQRFDGSVKDGRNREQERQNRIARIDSVLDAIGRREGKRSILLVATHAVIQSIKDGEIGKRFVDNHDVTLAHFGSLRGLNKHEKTMTTIILGKLEPNEDGARRIAAGISEDPDRVLASKPERVKSNALIALRDGRAGEISTSTYKDPDMARVLYQIREEEIVQAEQRIRAARRQKEDIRSYIIGDVIPASFRFDDVYHIKDFMKSKLDEVAEAYHGCLSALAYQDLHGTTAQAARQFMKKHDFQKSSVPVGWQAWTVQKDGARGAPMYVYGKRGEVTENAVALHVARLKEWALEDVRVLPAKEETAAA